MAVALGQKHLKSESWENAAMVGNRWEEDDDDGGMGETAVLFSYLS
jgi:hypothetical protein